MNVLNNHYLRCSCNKIINDLINFTAELILERNEQQWEKLNIFTEQCSCQKTCDTDGTSSDPCLHEFFKMMLQGQSNIFEMKVVKLSTLLVNAITFMYQEQPCLFNRVNLHRVVTNEYSNDKQLKYYGIAANVVALDGISEFMKILVNFDLILSLKENSRKVLKKGISINIYHFVSLHLNATHMEKLSMTKKIRELSSLFFSHNNNYLGIFERMYLATVAVRATQFMWKNEENKAKEYMYCLRMYFADTLDPLITINEVRFMLYACFSVLKQLHLFDLYYEEFVKLMPECPANFEFRNLSDFARLKIRKNLKKSRLPLAVAVEKLGLPPRLRNFILGDVIVLPRKNGNIVPEQIVTMSQLAELMPETELS